MDKKIAGLLGAAAALTTMTAAAQASPAPTTEPTAVTSYRDLLDPVSNAVPALKADDARLAAEQKTQAETQVAQIHVEIGRHHHHHHHHWWRRHRHHHHHHHHHHHY